MKERYDLVIVMPIGPGCDVSFVMDTINSIIFYCHCSCKFVLIDDSGSNLGEEISKKMPEAKILVNAKRYGLAGGLYITLSIAYAWVTENYDFKTLLKIDTDALVTGIDPQKFAENIFAKSPNTGIVGLHKLRNEAYSFNTSLDNKWPREHLIRATCSWRFIKRPIGNLALRNYLIKALANGYELGENVFGGAYFMNPALLKKLYDNKLLPDFRLQNSRLEEDHLFGLLAKVVNFDMADLAKGDLPFACAWKTLPASPAELHQKGKKIVHSTRAWGNLDEKDIRSYFKNIRNALAIN